MKILALNCGSSSVKYQLFDWVTKTMVCKGLVERIGMQSGSLTHEPDGKEPVKIDCVFSDHSAALECIISTLTDKDHGVLQSLKEIAAVGHRVVHGGSEFQKSTMITEEVLTKIKALSDLAPLHIPANVQGIEAAQKVLTDVPNIAVFDTAFHQTMPPYAYLYGLPYEWYEMYGVRKYGFHGSSHLYVSRRASVLLGKKPKETNVITVHIGNGVSLAAIKHGICIDTTMGMTPLSGAIMGTRSGDFDPAILIFMIEKEGFNVKELDKILNYKSGLLGISGKYSDRRDIETAAAAGDFRSILAIDIEVYRLKKYIGAYMAAIGDVHAIVFTAGAGEMDQGMREKVLRGLEPLGVCIDKEKNKSAKTRKKETTISTAESKVKIFVIPTNEEIVFIEDVVAILEGRYNVHTGFQYSFELPEYKNK
jgi:acetate kinase